MIKIIFLAVFIMAILFLLKKKSKSSIYSKLIFLVIVITILFVVATSGKLILPQILQILKFGIPFVTKLIGI